MRRLLAEMVCTLCGFLSGLSVHAVLMQMDQGKVTEVQKLYSGRSNRIWQPLWRWQTGPGITLTHSLLLAPGLAPAALKVQMPGIALTTLR